MQVKGADIVVKSLKEEGVEYVFGYPGGAALHIYDAFHRQDDVQHILVRHEQGATHAADGYARATGKPGVVLVTSGPGVTNAITGLATAYMDSVPMVVLSGQVMQSLIGYDAFQEIDAIGISRPCVKHNFLIQDVNDIASTIKRAFHIATSGRPGPVLVDIPKDITAELAEFIYPESVEMRAYPPVPKPALSEMVSGVEAMLNAKRPVIYTGGGIVIAHAQEELRTLVRTLGFPCTNTLMGLGAYPHDDPLFLGMLGMHGTYEANKAMHEADLIVALGARFDDRITGTLDNFAPHAKILHVDIDPSVIDKNIKADIAIIGDVKEVLNGFNAELERRKKDINPELTVAWWHQINDWRGFDSLWYEHSDTIIKPQMVVQKLHEVTNGEAYVTSDVGQHQMFAAQFYGFSDTHRWINSGGLGTMGFGLPSAMGVKFAHPDADVACVTGEGSIQMCIQELATCKQYDLPIKIINLNNRYLGMVRQWQEFNYERRYSNSYMDSLPDFVKLTESYGHVGMLIEKPGDVEGALREAFAMKDRLVFMDFITDQTENVYPMIEAGKGHNDMRLRPGSKTVQEYRMRHIISVLLENESGALSRVSGLFSARGYNIESLTVAPTNDPTLSRMTIVTIGDDRKVDQIEKHLSKLVDVAALQDITVSGHLEREIVLVKLKVPAEQAEAFDRVVKSFNATAVHVSENQYIVEMSGSSEKIDELLTSFKVTEVIEVVRSGVIGLASDERVLRVTPRQIFND